MRGWGYFLLAICLAVTPVVADASDCPDFGLTEAKEKEFCEEFRALLYAPFSPNSDRNSSSEDQRRIDALIEEDPLWGEVYRADPRRTLELLTRIRDAGGYTDS